MKELDQPPIDLGQDFPAALVQQALCQAAAQGVGICRRARDVAPDEAPANWEEVALYLKAVTDSRYFLGPDKALVLAKDAKSTSQAVRLALAFEKETLVFYLEAADMVPTLNQHAIQSLVREERAHVRKLTGFLQTCQK